MTVTRPSHTRRFRATLPPIGGRWLLAGAASMATVDAVLLRIAGLRIDVSAVSLAFAALLLSLGLARVLFDNPRTITQRTIRDLSEGIGLFGLASLLGAVASYPIAAISRGYVDGPLQAADEAMRFDWIALYEMVAFHPAIQPLERAAYLSIFVTPLLLIGAFAVAGQRTEIRWFVARFAIGATMTLLLFPLLPAAGPLATLWHGRVPYMPVSALYQDQTILALRDHTIRDIDLGALHGLVCAPSFHAATAIIYMATAWRVQWLRWPLIALDCAMLAATPIEGTHYLIDVVAGASVALLALAVTPLPAVVRGAFGAGAPVVSEGYSLAAE